jgi:SAM-dependent methyltransferase
MPTTLATLGLLLTLQSPALEQFHAEAQALRPLVESPLASRFLDAVDTLPTIAPRTIAFDPEKKAYLTSRALSALPEDRRTSLREIKVDDNLYYQTRYGSPLSYARALDVLGRRMGEGPKLDQMRIMDFGYGTVGHLRLLASQGADVVGVDVDPMLTALYSEPGDQGEIPRRGGGRPGQLSLIEGRFPADAAVRERVGGDFDLFLSKNTLKRGYIHPERSADPRRLVQLGVDDAGFLKTVHDVLKPGGWFFIYNLAPAPAPPDKPYLPHADGRCPFTVEQLEQAGFTVLAHDINDDQAARALGRALGWDREPIKMDLDGDLFAIYALMRRSD